jgi:hypothetical protein
MCPKYKISLEPSPWARLLFRARVSSRRQCAEPRGQRHRAHHTTISKRRPGPRQWRDGRHLIVPIIITRRRLRAMKLRNTTSTDRIDTGFLPRPGKAFHLRHRGLRRGRSHTVTIASPRILHAGRSITLRAQLCNGRRSWQWRTWWRVINRSLRRSGSIDR